MTCKSMIWLSILAAVATAWSAPSSAHMVCLKTADLPAVLGDPAETPRAAGLNFNKQLFVIYAAPNGFWTLAYSNRAGDLCIADAGRGFHLLQEGQPTAEDRP